MPRPWRIEYPGAMHHVTGHGVAGQDIFLSDTDRHRFLGLLDDMHQRWGTVAHAYCLMGNHYHLLVETPDGALSAPMKWLNQTYAQYVNCRLERAGHLFQGRFKSILVQTDPYLYELSRYIHNNPVKAGFVATAAEYIWSSYRAYIGLVQTPRWLCRDLTLSRFGVELLGRRAYRAFVEGCDASHSSLLLRATQDRILGSQQFVEAIRLQFADAGEEDAGRRAAALGDRAELPRITQTVASELGVSEDGMRMKGRKQNRARDIAIYLAARRHGHRLAEVGEYYGGIGADAASRACSRVEMQVREIGSVRELVEAIAMRIDGLPGSHPES